MEGRGNLRASPVSFATVPPVRVGLEATLNIVTISLGNTAMEGFSYLMEERRNSVKETRSMQKQREKQSLVMIHNRKVTSCSYFFYITTSQRCAYVCGVNPIKTRTNRTVDHNRSKKDD